MRLDRDSSRTWVCICTRGAQILAVAGPEDPMPGGGHFVTASFFVAAEVHVNNPGEVAFTALLDTDVNGDRFGDTGLYVWSHGTVQ